MDLYREHILDHYQNPRNHGTLSGADVTIDEQNPLCGDKLKLMYNLDGNRISEMKFEGEGCAISLAAASMLTEELTGKTVTQAAVFTDQDMLTAIGMPLSPTRVKCGLLALSGLRRSLAEYTKENERHQRHQPGRAR